MDKKERRRAFVERLKSHIANMNLPLPLAPDLGIHVVELMSGNAPVVWIQGQNCTGCTCALLDSDHFTPSDLAFDRLSIRYQPDLMAGTGNVATGLLHDIGDDRPGRYVLVVEGAIPEGEFARFCTFGIGRGEKDLMGRSVPEELSIKAWLELMVPDAAAVVSIGNCATYGGIPGTITHVTGAAPVPDVVRELDPGKPVICVTGCPPHPDWLVGTIESTLRWVLGEEEMPELDDRGRVGEFYAPTIHDLCERLPAFKEKRFLEDWNDVRLEEDRCLLKLGCMGPKTHGDCPTRLWNSLVNWCVSANAPCYGCTEPDFTDRMRQPGAKKKRE